MLEVDAEMIKDRVGLLLISDKNFASLLRPSRKKEVMQAGEPMLKKVRQLIESVNDTLKGQLDLEQHSAHSVEGVAVRVAQRVLALAAAIWHNFRTCQPVTRSLTAYDH
ncbi:hypothetical protein [Saccharopolyspora sp. ASAGF58]|uniref:hypothetical protein n=1 Tax=Saccharopolyspora sp. ASAGF58 TaxID=2719023 RepID=UPI001B314D6C|nr:hypothetical protein [Saccharopolyspora sp. ASAGF58]